MIYGGHTDGVIVLQAYVVLKDFLNTTYEDKDTLEILDKLKL